MKLLDSSRQTRHLRTLMSFIGILSALIVFGCASMSSSVDTEDGAATGIRYYNSAPFILAYSDGKGGVEAKLVYLPDTTQVMSLDTSAFMAQNKTTLKFDKSILTTSDAESDATAVPKAIVEAAKLVAMQMVSPASGNVFGTDVPAPSKYKEYETPAPYLFRIYYSPLDHCWQLVGGQGSVPIRSTFVRTAE